MKDGIQFALNYGDDVSLVTYFSAFVNSQLILDQAQMKALNKGQTGMKIPISEMSS